MKTKYLSLRAQVAVVTFFLKFPVSYVAALEPIQTLFDEHICISSHISQCLLPSWLVRERLNRSSHSLAHFKIKCPGQAIHQSIRLSISVTKNCRLSFRICKKECLHILKNLCTII